MGSRGRSGVGKKLLGEGGRVRSDAGRGRVQQVKSVRVEREALIETRRY